ncbi:MAG: NAD(P)H-dependent flavin oxidoreductase [Candidatus Helarchaeota archaeon]
MVIKTRMTEIFGCKYPIMLAGMGPFSTYKTAVQVANAGGIGLTSHWGILSPVDPETHLISDKPNARVLSSKEKIIHDLHYIAEHAVDGAVLGCNIRVARIQVDWPSLIRAVIKEREKDPRLKELIKLIVTSAGDPRPPDKLIKRKAPDLVHLHVSPALSLVDHTFKSGCDGVVAVGYEGGGHQSYEQVVTSILVPEVREKYPDSLIIAGGGMVTGRSLAAALALGADGIQMGSRFIATSDGDFAQTYKDKILGMDDRSTMMCDGAFGPIRLFKNKYALSHPLRMSREERIQYEKSMGGSIDQGSDKFIEDMKAYDLIYKGDTENGAVLVGQTVALIHDLPTCKEVIERIMKEAEEVIKHNASLIS